MVPSKKRQSRPISKITKTLSLQSIASSPKRLIFLGVFASVFVAAGVFVVARVNADATRIVCDYTYPSLCLNRMRGGTGNGTPIIAYTRDFDNNENFRFAYLTNYCGSGHVTSTCPFAVGSGLNTRYQGNPILAFLDNSDQTKCVTAQNPSAIVLEPCGATGYVFVRNTVKGSIGHVENVHWSNQNYSAGHYNSPSWMCAVYGTLVLDNSDFGNSCGWADE
jgi:hypothetical protein